MEVVNAAVFGNIAPQEYIFRRSIPESEKAPPLKMGPKKEKKEKKEKAPPPPTDSASTVDTMAPPPPPPPEKPEKGGKKDKKEKTDKKEKKEKKGKPGADPIVTDSINPFVDLPTAPPTAAPSEAVRRSKDKENRNSKEHGMPPPPPEFTEVKVGKGHGPGQLEHGQGMPPSGGKPGWRRVSTRQWIRDFRDHIGKFQTYPYKPICGMFFWSFGYYPDMVPQDSYQKYVAKHPISTRRHSTGSHGGELMPMGGTDTEISMTSTTDMSDMSKMTTDDNMNLPPLLPPLPDKKGKGKKGKGEEAPSATDTETEAKGSGSGKKSKKGKGKAEEAPSATATESEAEGKGKGKKGKKGKEPAAASEAPSTTATEAESGAEKSKKGSKGKGKKGAEDAAAAGAAAEEGAEAGKKGKKGKKGDAPADAAAAPAEGAAAEGGKGKKGKKGAKGVAPEGGETTATEASTDAEAGAKGKGKGKGKKGAEMPVSAVSGNISFDPAVYDLTSLTVMNLPAGADAKKLGKLFPGGKVTVDGGGATVKFKDVAAAQPFFTKDVSLDGQGLVVSPKLKS